MKQNDIMQTIQFQLPIHSEDLLNYLQLHEKESMDTNLPYAYLVHKSKIVFEPKGSNTLIFVTVQQHKTQSCFITLQEKSNQRGNITLFFIELFLGCILSMLSLFHHHSIPIAIMVWIFIIIKWFKHSPFLKQSHNSNITQVKDYIKKIAHTIEKMEIQ